MNLLSDVLIYFRRIIKSPSNASVSDNLLIDYINRFWIMDVDARMELYDLKTTYQFQTSPGVDQYNMPLYGVNGYVSGPEPGGQLTNYYPVYQGFMDPCWVNGISVPFFSLQTSFYNNFPNYTQQLNQVATGDGATLDFTFNLPFFPALRGHVDMAGIIASGSNVDPLSVVAIDTAVPKTSMHPAVWITSVDDEGNTLVVSDSGQFYSTNANLGLLTGDITTSWGLTNNVVNYNTGVINVTFSAPPDVQAPINVQCYFIQQGLPRGILYFNNTITLRPPSNISYQVEMTGFLTPAAFLATTQSLPFAYMGEYLARGAARKYLADVGDTEQFMQNEGMFKEQEILVWKRSQRVWTSTRTPTIFSDPSGKLGVSYGGTNGSN
jgi:hypothetical protein